MKIMRGRKMKIGIGNDHVAVEMKNEIKDVTILNMGKQLQMLLLQVRLTVAY